MGEMRVETKDGQHHFQLQVHLSELSPSSVNVEVYADALPGGPVERHAMNVCNEEASGANSHLYSVSIPAPRPASDYTARIIANNPEAIIPLEAPQILWQR